MTMTDPIADMLTRIRNANRAYHGTVDIPDSKVKEEIARILKEEGYIKDYQVIKENGFNVIRAKMSYGPDRERVITGIKRISKPGLRVYAKKGEVPRVLGGLGTAIISTSKGVMTGLDAKKAGLGGEVICYVW
ncbi:MAG TPA: 30S ribosomal protein S8 [Anaerolineae bacterium]|nr:30S ribosomal protein S8 [Anaerolineae bacterium]